MSAKVSVKGDDIDPLFKYLSDEAEHLGAKDPIKWNFTKFLIDRNGNVVGRFAPTTAPEALGKEIESLLQA